MRSRGILLAPVLALIGACDPGTEPAPVPARIELSEGSLTLDDAAVRQLTATVLDGSGAPIETLPGGLQVVWASRDTAIATVQAGEVTARRPGETEVSAALGSLRAVVPVEVNAVPTLLQRVSEEARSGTAAQPLSDSLVVRVIDRHLDGVPGVEVEFTPTAGGGTVAPQKVVTDSQGRARARWTLGPRAGEQRVEANVPSRSFPGVTFAAMAGAGPGSQLAQVSGDAQADTVLATLPKPLAVRVTDAAGNPVAGSSVTWTTTGGSVSPAISVTDSTGLATATWKLGREARVVTATATAVGKQVRFTSTAGAGSLAFLTIAASRSSIEPGDTTTVGATGADAYGNTIPDLPITWTVSSDSLVRRTEAEGVLLRLRALAPGAASVSASAGGRVAQTVVTVVTPRYASVSVGMVFSPVVSILSNHFCALSIRGLASCRSNLDGLRRMGPRVYRQISAGRAFTCALDPGGQAYCWGMNDAGQLGATASEICAIGKGGGNRLPCSAAPLLAAGGKTFRSLSAGDSHVCAIGTDDRTYCWGRNDWGQLGDGEVANSQAPVAVQTTRTFSQVSAGGLHTCAVEAGTGAGYCWGRNDSGQHGIGPTTSSRTPVLVSNGLVFQVIRAGENATCGQTGDALYCWGQRYGTTPADPIRRGAVRDLGVGQAHGCLLTLEGTIECWGDGRFGQLGTGTTGASTTPVPVAGGLAYQAIDVGGDHGCGLTSDGRVLCWGGAYYGPGGLVPTAPSGFD